MSDLAVLGIKVDASDVDPAAAGLDRLTAAGIRAEAATGGLGTASSSAAKDVRTASQAAADMTAQLDASAAGAARQAAQMTGASGAAAEMANVTQRVGGAFAEASTHAEKMAVAAARITQAEELAAKAGITLSGAQMEVVGSGRMSAEQMVQQAAAAETAAAAQTRLAAASDAATGSIARGAAAMTAAGSKVGQSLKLTAHEGLNFSRQFADIGVTAAMGMNPFMIALQQGPQLFDVLQMTATRTGASIGAVVKALGVQIWTALAPVLPVLLAIAAAAGVVYGAFKLWTSSGANAEVKAYANTLGLTKKEMKELGDTSVTLGDAMAGLWKTFDDATGLSDMFASIKEWAVDAFETALAWGKQAAATIYAGFVGAYRAIKEIWSDLPKVLGEAAINAANAAITAMENLINKAIDALNALRKRVDPIMIAADMAGIDLGIGHVKLGQIENQFAGAGAAAAGAFAKAYAEEYTKAMAWMDKVGATIADNIIGAAKDRLAKRAKELIDDRPEKAAAAASKDLSDAMEQELLVTEMQIAALGRIAQAYGKSSAAGLRMEIVTKAETDALKKKASAAETALYIDQQLRLAVAERLADAESEATLLREQTAAQKGVNDQVAAGLITAEKAAELLQIEAALRPYVLALTLAEGKAYDDLAKAIERARTEMGLANAEAKRAQDIQRAGDARAQIKMLTSEIDLTRKLGAARLDAMSGLRGLALDDELARINAEHEKELILLRAKVDAEKARKEGLFETADALMELAREQIAAVDVGLETEKLEAAFHTLKDITDSLDFGSIFGRGGEAINGMTAALERLNDAQTAHRTLLVAAGGDTAKIAAADKQYQMARQAGTLAMIGSAKSFFKEQSTGYKAMEAAEKAFALLQLANNIKALVMDTTRTGAEVANSAVRATAKAGEGAASMFASLGPFGFPAVAAMIAVLAGLGVAVSGGGGGGYKPPTAEELQASQGTGSVLGDAEAKSGSLGNALDLMLKNTNKDLEYSSEMVRSLRAIESNIGALTGLLARQLNVSGGAFDTSGLGLGSKTSLGLMGNAALLGAGGLAAIVIKEIPIIGDILGGIAKALFGTKKTVTLLDQGLSFAAQTVEDIVNGGMIGQIYQDVQTQTKKKFLGLTTSNKTKVTTQYGDLSNDMERQVALIIGSLRSGIVDAAEVIGVTGAQAALDAFTVNLGKISLKDLKGDEIREALEAVFSKLGDDMAAAVMPGLEAFQRVGEGLFETLARLAKDYTTIDTALTAIGMTFGAVGLASVAARENLIDLFGGLDAFAEATYFFRENFLTEAEQMAPIIAAVSAEMARLGHAGVTTNEQFKALVLGLDLSTASGAEMYASLMAVAPAFAKVNEYAVKAADEAAAEAQRIADAAAKAAEDAAQAIRELAEAEARLAQQRTGLMVQLLETVGRSGAALALQRAEQLRQLPEGLRALQAQLWQEQDLKTAREDAARVASEQAELEWRIMDLTGRSTEALSLRRATELEKMDESLRPFQERIWALEAEAEAAETARRLAEQRMSMEVELIRAQGRGAEALASSRDLELQAMDESLRPLKLLIWATQDAAEANEIAARAADEAARAAEALAATRAGMEIELMRALGQETEALAAQRAMELAALDPVLHALQQQIYTAEDAAKAAEELARQNDLAAKAAEDAAAAEARLAQQRTDLHLRLLEAQGQSEAALAMRREMEISAADASLHALLRQIHATEDAARAQEELAATQAEAARVAEELARTRRTLDIELMEAMGQAEAALVARRMDALAALDVSLRPLQELVWQYQDAAEAQRAAAEAAEAVARSEAELMSQRTDLELRLLDVLGETEAALIRRRELETASVDASLHALLGQIYAAEDAAKAAEALARAQEEAAAAAQQQADAEARLAQQRGDMEIQLLEALGRETEALVARRAMELAALDASLHGLQDQIWAAQDAARAAEELARAQEEAAEIARRLAEQHRGYEIRIMELSGDAVGALTARRADELAATDASLHALLRQIYALEDQAAASEEAARAAAEATEIERARAGLTIALLEAQGQSEAALALAREGELAALDPLLHALQQQVWAAQDAAAAQAELARQQQEAAQAAEDLRKAGVDLHIRYFDLLGDTAAASALRRQEEMAATDASLHALLRQIYALEDAKAAEEAYAASLSAKNSRVEQARNALSAAYDRESGALEKTIDQFGKFGESLRAFRAGLFAADAGTAASYRQLQVDFIKTAALAGTGDVTALGGLQGSGTAFLEASRAQASTLAQYQRDVAMVARSVDTAIGAADTAVDYAQLQLDALTRLVGGYIDLNDNVLTVNEAIQQLRAADMEEVVPATVTPIVSAQETQTQVIRTGNERLEAEIVDLKATIAVLLRAVADSNDEMRRILKRMDGGDYMKVGSDPDTPVHVKNTPATPIYTDEVA